MQLNVKRWKVSSILYIMFVLMIVLPISMVAFFSLRAYTSILLENSTSQTIQTLKQVSYSLSQENSRYIHTIASIATDKSVLELTASLHHEKDTQSHFRYAVQLDEQMKGYFHDMPDLISATFIFHDGSSYYYEGPQYYEHLTSDVESLRQLRGYKQALSAEGHVQMLGTQVKFSGNLDTKYILSAAIAPRSNPLLHDVEMIYFFYKSKALENLADSSKNDSGFVVLDSDGEVMLATGGANQTNGLEPRAIEKAMYDQSGHYNTIVQGMKMFITFLTMDSTGWKLVYLIPYDQFTFQFKQIYYTMMEISGAGFIFFLIVSVFMVRRLSRSISVLVRQMNRVKSGEFDVKITATGPLEIHLLGKTFESMVLRIQDLMRELREREKQKTHAEIDALQSQINPHFLVNTLSAIKVMAMISKNTNIYEMTDSLVKILSSTFNRNGSYIQLKEELMILEKYIHIMKIRYGDRFKVEFSFQEGILETYVLKLLLQPFLENAIYHGVQESEPFGYIHITGKKENECLVLMVQDNGRGMDQQTAQSLLRKHAVNGIGIANVNDRIRLNYGEAYGVQIQSEVGSGTTVTVRLPLILTMPEESSNLQRLPLLF